jgi:hypothetical protein
MPVYQCATIYSSLTQNVDMTHSISMWQNVALVNVTQSETVTILYPLTFFVQYDKI